MTDYAQVNKNSKVLEIGTGCGYQCAVLAEIAKEVYTVERIPQLFTEASTRLSDLGYKNVHFTVGDGYKGWSEHSPYDSIIVTAGARKLPMNLVEQLAIGGIMIIPVDVQEDGVTEHQELLRITRSASNIFSRESLTDVRFVPMIPDINDRIDDENK